MYPFHSLSLTSLLVNKVMERRGKLKREWIKQNTIEESFLTFGRNKNKNFAHNERKNDEEWKKEMERSGLKLE